MVLRSQCRSRNRLLRGLGVQSVAAVLLGGQLCIRSGVPGPSFTGGSYLGRSACGSSSQVLLAEPRTFTHRVRSVRRHAGGFSYGQSKGSGKGFADDAEAVGDDQNEETKEASTELVKDKREGKTKALSTTKLKNLRDKTLALRQKREAELDEYEEGRAMIAKYGPKVAVMPEKVAQRAAKRGMVIGGSFYGVMILVFAVGIFIYKTQELIIPPTLMAFITLALLALSIMGSSYGLMSASWDEDREGSVLGTEEFSKNVGAIGEGFRRMSMQNEYDKAIELRKERRKLLKAKEDKRRELLNK